MVEEANTRISSLQNYEREHLKEIEQVAASERDIIAELWVSKKERIRKYADSLAERVELKDPTLDIFAKSQVSSYLAKKYREVGASEGALAYIRELLPDEYKNPNLVRENDNGNGLVFKDSDGEDTLAKEKLLSKPIEQMDHATAIEDAQKIKKYAEQIKALQQAIRDSSELLQAKAEKEGWSDVKLKPKINSTPKPDPRITKLYQAFERAEERCRKLKEKAYEFPPDIEEEEKYAQAVDTLFSIFDPMIDEKWSTDWISPEGWLQLEKWQVITFKHHAGKKFGVMTPKGEWREITREQVGDKFPDVVDQTTEFYNAIPGIMTLTHWYITKVKPRIGERKTTFINSRWQK